MSFAIETARPEDFQHDEDPIAGRIGQPSPSSEASSPSAEAESPTDEASSPSEPESAGDPPAADAEDQWWQEIEIIGRLRDVELERQAAAEKFEELTQERKAQKKVLDGLCVELQELASELVAVSAGKTFPKKRETEPTTDAPTPWDVEPTDWRNKQTTDLLAGTKGLGQKKLDAIAAEAPTVGDLEDLRAKASSQHKPFKEVLPRGCGQAIADAIEDRLIDHIAKSSTPPASEQVKENADWEAGEETPVAWEPSEADKKAMQATVDSFFREAEQNNWEAEDVEADPDLPEMVEGFEAFKAGQYFMQCPYNDQQDCERDLWLNGWVWASYKKKLRAEELDPTNSFDDL